METATPIRDPNRPEYHDRPNYGGAGLYGAGGGYFEAPPEAEGSGIFSFWDLLRILMKWWWMVALLVIVASAVTAFLTLRETPMYRATTTIEIKQRESNILDVRDVEQVNANREYMSTQYSLLQSTALAERVVEDLYLASDPAFANQNSPREARVRQAAGRVRGGLRIEPVGNSRLINITYQSPDPATAARIADAVAEGFISYNLDRKYNATSYAREFLEERIAATKAALEQSERELIRYAEEQGIVNIHGSGGESAAQEGASSLDSAALASLNSELTAARSERISIEQRYRQAQENVLTPDIQNNPTIGSLQERRANLNAEYQEKLSYLKPGFPEMQELQSRIDFLDQQIADERQNVVAALKAQYDAAVSREQSLQSRVNELKDAVINIRSRSVDYNILQREVDTNRTQYDALLQRLKEISISDGVGTNLVSIVDRAKVPGRPFSPNLQRSVIMAALISAIIGFGLAYLIEFIDDRVKVPEDVKNKIGLPILGVIPMLRKGATLTQLLDDPKSSVVEAYASMRTNLQYTSDAGAPKVMQVTSTRSGEGKSSTSFALARSFAALKKKTLVIDADMRMPSFDKGTEHCSGLSGLLTSYEEISANILPTKVPYLFLLPSGKSPPNPSEILSSHRFEQVLRHARQHYDVIIVDSPPVLGLADAPLLGAKVDGTILVVEAGSIRTPSVKLTVERLRASGTKIIGSTLTKYKAAMSGYLDYYQYSYGQGANDYGPKVKKSTSRGVTKQKLEIL